MKGKFSSIGKCIISYIVCFTLFLSLMTPVTITAEEKKIKNEEQTEEKKEEKKNENNGSNTEVKKDGSNENNTEVKKDGSNESNTEVKKEEGNESKTEAKKKEKSDGNSQEDTVPVNAASAVLMEGSTGEVLYDKDKDKELVPASITKVMTLVLIFEALKNGKIKLEDPVTVSEYAAGMGGSQVYLEVGETQTVNDMIKCIAIASANDAAAAMAEHISGSETEFVKQMNQKAKDLGMEHTNFKNCSGLDDDIKSGHYTSAYDVALMSRELITKHPEVSKYSTVWMDTITHVTKKGESEFGLTNTNKLARFYKGITGLKTGSTSKAKYCLSATANRDGMDLIAVVMAAPDHKSRFSEAASLLDYGFANCTLFKDDHKKLAFEPQKITGGVARRIVVQPEKPFTHTFTKNVEPEKIKSEVKYHENIKAPISKGEPVGEIIYTLDGNELGRVNIVSCADIKKANYLDNLSQLVKQFFKCYK